MPTNPSSVPHAAIEAAFRVFWEKEPEYVSLGSVEGRGLCARDEERWDELEATLAAAQPHLIRAWIEGLSEDDIRAVMNEASRLQLQGPNKGSWPRTFLAALRKLAEPKEPK